MHTPNITLQDIALRYEPRFVARFGAQLSPEQWQAFHAITRCRRDSASDSLWECGACQQNHRTPRSCGHRACNLCQHRSTQDWLDRQQQKCLPLPYYMVTFTLPRELRGVARRHAREVYDHLMRCAIDTLQTFAANDPHLQGDLGLCAVLHTHTRRLDYHPHVHIVVPGGAIQRERKELRKARGRYLFNGRALAKVFRGKMLRALEQAGIALPITPQQWIAQCQRVGQGQEALQYLSRYLYRGVISNTNLIKDDGERVTFRYRDSQTQQWQTRTLAGEELVWLVLQHCLPKGFRRARDYGFLHGNAKGLLRVLQWVMRVIPPPVAPRRKARMCCPHCREPMFFVGVSLRQASG